MSTAVYFISLALLAQAAPRYGNSPPVVPAGESRIFDTNSGSASRGSASQGSGSRLGSQDRPSSNGVGGLSQLPTAGNRNPPASPQRRPAYGVPSRQAATGTINQTSNQTSASVSSATGANQTKPAQLMRFMLQPPSGAQLSGRSVALADVVRGASSRREQTERIIAYWDLSAAVADYYLGLREQQEFRSCASKATRGGQLWRQAENDLQVRVQTARRAAVAAQYRMASMTGNGSQSLPIPRDLPHCGDYNTRYNTVFGKRRSIEAEGLNQLLPSRYAELRAATASVFKRKEYLDTVARQVRADSNGREVVEALGLLALQRRAFVQIAKDYNRWIARYAELAMPGEVEVPRLVAMLIRRPGVSTATRPRPNRARQYGPGASIQNNNNNNNGGAARTFAQGQEWAPRNEETIRFDPSVMQTNGESQQTFRPEKSILKQP